jgi:two-component system sensor histidine kinase BarA
VDSDVDERRDGVEEALELLGGNDYDVIFMDIQMPSMSGEEAARHIREYHADGTVPTIVALTANAMQGERERLLATGMDDCLIKPITEDQVAQILARLDDSDTPSAAADNETGDEDMPTRAGLREEMQAMLLAELPQHKRAIQRAYRSNDVNDLQEKVHELRGAVSVCHIPKLKEACQHLENSVLAGDRVDIPSGVQRLMTVISDAVNDDQRRRAAGQNG